MQIRDRVCAGFVDMEPEICYCCCKFLLPADSLEVREMIYMDWIFEIEMLADYLLGTLCCVGSGATQL